MEGEVVGVNRGGLIVETMNIRGFCPGSHLGFVSAPCLRRPAHPCGPPLPPACLPATQVAPAARPLPPPPLPLLFTPPRSAWPRLRSLWAV